MLVMKNTADDFFAPMFVCDICKQPIKNADEGMVKFNEDESALFFCHYNDCDLRNDGYWMWHPLSVFLVWLNANTKFNKKRANSSAKMMEELSHR